MSFDACRLSQKRMLPILKRPDLQRHPGLASYTSSPYPPPSRTQICRDRFIPFVRTGTPQVPLR